MAEHDAADAVRRRFVEAFARRTAAHQGAARALLELRLAALTAADAVAPAPPPRSARADVTPPPSPLAGLLAHIARHAPADAAEPKTLRQFRSSWSRLKTEQRLAQSLSRLPENAGPLHSHRLVHRALATLGALSPEYLDRFVGHVEALLALDAALGAGGLPAAKDVVVAADARRRRGRAARG